MLPQSKINPRILCRTITHAALRLVVALEIPRGQFQRSPNSVPIRFHADQPHCDPMIALSRRRTAALVPEKLRVLAIIAHQKILPPVVVVISHRKPPSHSRLPKIPALSSRGVHKIPVAAITIKHLLFLVRNLGVIHRNVVQNMSVDHQKVPPAIMLKIEKSRAKSTA